MTFDRNAGIGSSDIAAIMGANPWDDSLSVYCLKRGLTEPNEETEAMRMGSLLEPVVIQRYKLDHPDGALDRSYAEHDAPPMTHAEFAWAYAHPDALVIGGGGTTHYYVGAVEAKAPKWESRQRWGPGGSGVDGVPEMYVWQCRWIMWVCGLPWIDVACLIGGHDYREYRIERREDNNDIAMGMMVSKAHVFWHSHVLKGEAPEPSNNKAAADALAELYAGDVKGDIRAVGSDISDLAFELRDAASAEKRVSERVIGLKNRLKQIIGNDAGISGPGFQITWIPNKNERRVFRMKFEEGE